MDEIIIKARNKRDEVLLLELAKRLKMEVKRPKKKRPTGSSDKWLNALAEMGGIKIANPVIWQRSNRKERTL